MFDIESLELDNFKSYTGHHEFIFPRGPGLYYLTGNNLLRPRMGANGNGKTSLLDAVQWCFYGHSTRGLRHGEVVTWGKKGCSVVTTARVGGKRFKVRRTQGPNSLTVIHNGKEEAVDQETLLGWLRLNEAAFNYSILLPQFGNSFFDLPPTAKLLMFSQIMDLDFWLEKSKKADKLTQQIEQSINGVDLAMAANLGRLGSLKEEIANLKEKSDRHEDEVAGAVAKIRENEKQAKLAHANLVKVTTAAAVETQRLLGEATQVAEAITELDAEWQAADDAFQKTSLELERTGSDVDNLRGEQTGFDRLEGMDCPTCSQYVTPRHVKTHTQKIQRVVDAKQRKIKELKSRCEAERVKAAKLSASYTKLKQIRKEVDGQYATAVQEQRDLEYDLRTSASVVAGFKVKIENVKGQTNPYKRMREEKQTLLAQLKQAVARQESELAQLREEREASSYWVGGFKRVRLFVVEQALKGLELEVNNSLASLGLEDWRIELAVERDNKAGGVTKGFVVFIYSPDHNEPVRWEAWSGGETQRLRLAGDLGLASLILERSGLSGQIEFHDEPSEHMSAEGLSDLLDTLYERALALRKRIWLADQNTTSFGDFAGVLTVTKDAKGSHLSFQGG